MSEGQPHTQKRKSTDERRREIAATALSLAGELGAAKLTTQAIADAMGVSQATIFRHFKTREELFVAAIGSVQSQLRDTLAQIFEDRDTAADVRLRNLLDTHLAFIAKRPGIARLLFSDSLHMEFPSVKDGMRKTMKGHAGRVATLIVEGQRQGAFADDADPVILAQSIVAMIQGLVLRWSVFDFSFPLENQGDVVWKIIWPALRPTHP